MRLFQGRIDGYFQTAPDGRVIFYPRLMFGPGYSVSERTERRLRRWLRSYFVFSTFILPTITVLFFRLSLILGFIAILFAVICGFVLLDKITYAVMGDARRYER